MTLWAAHSARPLTAGFAITAIGVLVAIGTVLGLTLLRPVLFAFAFGGLLILLPPLMMREPRAYWLFLFALSIPFDISKRTTTWMVQPLDLYNKYGLPASGTLSVDIYLADVVLIAMLIPWLVRLCLRHDSFYFPKIGYIFLLYLAYTLIVALLDAKSFYLSIFEWLRAILYFLAFIYVINNVVTRVQFRAIVLALFIGLVIGSGSVIAFYELGIGSFRHAFTGLYTQQPEFSEPIKGTFSETQTGYVTGHAGPQSGGKRSAGILGHPAHAAFYFEYILPIVLALLVSTRRARDRFFLAAVLGAGCLATYLTFSRAGLVGLFVGFVVFFAVGRWARLISQRAFAWCALLFLTATALTAPSLTYSLWARPETITKRLELNKEALATIWQRPFTGAGLNNSSAIMSDALALVKTARGREASAKVVHNYYLIVLIEVGLIGFVLYFTFFWQTVLIALRHMRAAEAEMKLLLVGIVAALAAIAIHNLGDPFGGHLAQAMLWLHAGLLIAVCRRVQTENALRAPRQGAPIAVR